MGGHVAGRRPEVGRGRVSVRAWAPRARERPAHGHRGRVERPAHRHRGRLSAAVSFPDPAVHVHRAADPPDLVGPPSVRFVAPGSATAGRFGLFSYRMAPRSPGPGPHVNRTFSESFCVLAGELAIFDGQSWPAFAPGIARERFSGARGGPGDRAGAVPPGVGGLLRLPRPGQPLTVGGRRHDGAMTSATRAAPRAGVRPSRNRGEWRPAADLPVARVAVDVPLAHLDRPFDYRVPEHLDATAVPGVRLRVRFAGRLVDGYLLERVAASDHEGTLAWVDKVVSPEPVLTPEVAALCRTVADRYAGLLADVLRLAVPPRHAKVEAEAPPERAAPASCPCRPGRGAGTATRAGPPCSTPWPGAGPPTRSGRRCRGNSGRNGWPRPRPPPPPPGAGRCWWSPTSVTSTCCTPPARRCSGPTRWSPSAPTWARRSGTGAGSRSGGVGSAWSWAPGRRRSPPSSGWPAGRLGRRRRPARRAPRTVPAGPRRAGAARPRRAGRRCSWPGSPAPRRPSVLVGSGWAREVVADRATVRAAMPRITALDETESLLGRDPDARGARLPEDRVRGGAGRARGGAAGAGAGAPVGLPALAGVRVVPGDGPLSALRGPARAHRAPVRGPARRRAGGGGPAAVPLVRAGGGRVPLPGLRLAAAARRRGRVRAHGGGAGSRVPRRHRPRVRRGRPVLAEVADRPELVVATPGAEPPAAGGYGAALLLDGWALLSRPDLRVAEETLRRWLGARALVRPHGDGGRVVLMADAALPVAQALVRWDPAGHAEAELAARAEVGFPPAVRMAAVEGVATAVAAVLAALPADVEVLGPVEIEPDSTRPGQEPEEPRERALSGCPGPVAAPWRRPCTRHRPRAARARRAIRCGCGSTPWRSAEPGRPPGGRIEWSVPSPACSFQPRSFLPYRGEPCPSSPSASSGTRCCARPPLEVTTFDAELRRLVADLDGHHARRGRCRSRRAADRRGPAGVHLQL